MNGQNFLIIILAVDAVELAELMKRINILTRKSSGGHQAKRRKEEKT
jgi:hypothetical protein